MPDATPTVPNLPALVASPPPAGHQLFGAIDLSATSPAGAAHAVAALREAVEASGRPAYVTVALPQLRQRRGFVFVGEWVSLDDGPEGAMLHVAPADGKASRLLPVSTISGLAVYTPEATGAE